MDSSSARSSAPAQGPVQSPAQAPAGRGQHKLQREQHLLQLAQQILQQEGFAGLTMDRLAALSDVSKGTLYNHFCSKEDVLTALCVDSQQRLLQRFQQALQLPGHCREQALALHYAYHSFSAHEPTLFLCLISASTPAVLEKSSKERLAMRQQLEEQLLLLCQQLLTRAAAQGQLQLPAGFDVAQAALLNWALAFGCQALLGPARQPALLSAADAGAFSLHSLNLLFDGMNWQPLSSDWDYQQSWRRIADQLASVEKERA